MLIPNLPPPAPLPEEEPEAGPERRSSFQCLRAPWGLCGHPHTVRISLQIVRPGGVGVGGRICTSCHLTGEVTPSEITGKTYIGLCPSFLAGNS